MQNAGKTRSVYTCYIAIMFHFLTFFFYYPDHCGRDRMVVEFTTTYGIRAYHNFIVISNPTYNEMYSIQLYLIKFVSDLWQDSGFLQVLPFPHQ